MSDHGAVRTCGLGTVLVPTDFSKGAELALGRAMRLPRARLHLIHVVPQGPSREAETLGAGEVSGRLDELAARARAEGGPDLEVTAEVLRGEPFVEIIRCSRTVGADLVVLGRHGRRTLRDLFLGSTAERVLRKGDVPVLVVNLNPAGPYRNPVIATDFGDASHRTFDLLLRVLGPGPRAVRVVSAYEVAFEGYLARQLGEGERREFRMEMRKRSEARSSTFLDRYRGLGVQWKVTLRVGDPRSVVVRELEHRQADVVALGTHARSGVAHALLGSVAERVVSAAPCDVLVARPIRFSFEMP